MSKQKTDEDKAADAADRAAALRLFPLPPDCVVRFDFYAAALRKWQRTINLVAPSTLPQLWTRHFADSLQVQAAARDARHWVDLGSGAGFPGLPIAIRLADTADAKVHLIDSDQRKCAFLREVSRETGAPVDVHQARIEDIVPHLVGQIDAVCARAVAPTATLLAYSAPLIDAGATGVFLKGEGSAGELTDPVLIDRFPNYEFAAIRSVTLPAAQLIVVTRKALDKL